MSITDEGTRSSSEPDVSEKPASTQPTQNGAGQPAQGLPGLAGFGQMQGYAPVTEQPSEAAAPAAPIEVEPAAEPEIPVEPLNNSYAQDYSPEPQVYDEYVPPVDGLPDTGEAVSYAGEDIQSYVTEQHVAHEDALHDDVLRNTSNGGYESGEALHPEPVYQGEAGSALQTFEAHYDQHPEIPLGAFEGPGEPVGEQPFYPGPGLAGDAEFMGGETAPDVAAPKERRVRKILMASSGLIGVLALGGALAFAYKIGGDSDMTGAGKAPLIQADNRPVKVAPEKPGGRQFPNRNKKIFERLQGENSQEVERLVPRQEGVAAAATAALANSQPASGAAGQNPSAPVAGASPTGAPRKVKTLTVRPDGTIEAVSPRQKVVRAPAARPSSASDGTVSMSFPQPTASPAPPVAAPVPAAVPVKKLAVAQPASVAPPPVQKPSVPRNAAPAPAPQRTASVSAASGGDYVVQVASRKSQTDALAAFADIQQKYPRLLSGYRPIIQRADLGSKGVWYRLNVGPVEGKQVASSLCKSLKGAGMRSCIIRAQ